MLILSIVEALNLKEDLLRGIYAYSMSALLQKGYD